ncbi:type III pantothenate kinase [Thiomicrospira pelophila]|uniref:type III pantothenate kinase n=1 Tax=Thiomicrospira pelophila TaxID=934 RepID=UPI0004A714D0|nr:type III pantothenate kinase [Thiomicrospira pelophila]
MNWLIDFGNTNVKWAYVLGDDYLYGGSLEYANSVPKELLKTIYKNSPVDLQPKNILIASVGKPSFVLDFCELLIDSHTSNVRIVESSMMLLGIKNSYANPVQLGIDRLLAMGAAYYQVKHSACIVVDIGTAVTLDCVDQTGNHLGGLIVPGKDLMLKSLKSESAKLDISRAFNLELSDLPLLGKNTQDGVHLGIHFMIVNFIQQQVEKVHNTLLAEQKTSLFLTGGGSKVFRQTLGEDWIYEPGLVLKGLYLLLMTEINQ